MPLYHLTPFNQSVSLGRVSKLHCLTNYFVSRKLIQVAGTSSYKTSAGGKVEAAYLWIGTRSPHVSTSRSVLLDKNYILKTELNPWHSPR